MKSTQSVRTKSARAARYLSLAVWAHALGLSGVAMAQQSVGLDAEDVLGCALGDRLTACDFVERELDRVLEPVNSTLQSSLTLPFKQRGSAADVSIEREAGECSVEARAGNQLYTIGFDSPWSWPISGKLARKPLVVTARAPFTIDGTADLGVALRERLFGRCRIIASDTFRMATQMLGAIVGRVEIRANPRLETLASGDLLLTLAPDISLLASLVEPELSFELFDASPATELFVRSQVDTEELVADAVENFPDFSANFEGDLRQNLSEALKLDSNGELRFRVAKDFKERIARDGEAAAVLEALN